MRGMYRPMVQTAAERFEPRDLPLPEIGADDALLRVEACGICGSDVESFQGVLKVPLPLIPGHEPLGVIETIGERAAQRWGVQAGDRVAVETLLPCNACRRCRSGAYQLCASRRVYSYIPLAKAPGLWGAYAEYLYLAPNAIVHKVDPSLPAEIAVLFNPLGAGFRWAVEMHDTAGDRAGDGRPARARPASPRAKSAPARSSSPDHARRAKARARAHVRRRPRDRRERDAGEARESPAVG
jgi:threonine dehydrogenase-like Zn-dependent dehydrogenase